MLKFETRRVANSYGGKTKYRAMLTEKVSVAYMDYNNAKAGETHGSHAYATVVE